MSKILTKSNLLTVLSALTSVLAGLIFYKTTADMTPIVAGTCGFLTTLFLMAIEFVYLNVIKETKHKYVVEEIVGGVIGAIVLTIVL